MKNVKIRVEAPPEMYRDGQINQTPGGFDYLARFLRESIRRTGGSHTGVTMSVEVVDEYGKLERLVQTVTLVVADDGSIRLLQEQAEPPSFLTETPVETKGEL
jgi:hypothetical protein